MSWAPGERPLTLYQINVLLSVDAGNTRAMQRAGDRQGVTLDALQKLGLVRRHKASTVHFWLTPKGRFVRATLRVAIRTDSGHNRGPQ